MGNPSTRTCKLQWPRIHALFFIGSAQFLYHYVLSCNQTDWSAFTCSTQGKVSHLRMSLNLNPAYEMLHALLAFSWRFWEIIPKDPAYPGNTDSLQIGLALSTSIASTEVGNCRWCRWASTGTVVWSIHMLNSPDQTVSMTYSKWSSYYTGACAKYTTNI